MNTLYDKFLKRLQEIREYEWDNNCIRIHEEFTGPNGTQKGIRPGETALQAIARNLAETLAETPTEPTKPAETFEYPPRYTETLRSIVKLANQEAGQTNTLRIEAHHLLIAIAKEGTTTPAKFIHHHLNIDTHHLTNYIHTSRLYSEWYTLQPAPLKDIFQQASQQAQKEQVYTNTHHLFTTLLTIGHKQPNQICHLLSQLSQATHHQKTKRTWTTDPHDQRVTPPHRILNEYLQYPTNAHD